MASINGVQLKGLKSFMGMEGPAQQGNIYLDNKKVGFFSQDGNGGESRIEVNTAASYDEFKKRSEKYFEKFPPAFGPKANADLIKACASVEAMFDELVMLCDFEKDYKKAVKKGYNGIAYVSQTIFHDGPAEASTEYMYTSKDFAEKDLEDKINDDNWNVNLYFSPDDFAINC